MRENLMELLTEVCPGVDFEWETALVDDGILDIPDIAMIVAELQLEYDVTITVDDLVPENFNSVDAIMDMLISKV